VHINLDFYYI